MKLQEIKDAVESGKTVCWKSKIYKVVRDNVGQWLIRCTINDNYISLTHKDGVTMNGNEDEFYILEGVEYIVVHQPSGETVKDGLASISKAYDWLEKACNEGTIDPEHVNEYVAQAVEKV